MLEALLGRIPALSPATLSGYTRYAIQGRPYPAIAAAAPPASVSGCVIRGLTRTEWEVLDEFEGEEYAKTGVEVEAGAEGRVSAVAYVYSRGLAPELYGSWDYDTFRR